MWRCLTTCGTLLNSINVSLDLVISCSVRADILGVKLYFMSCLTACVRPKLDIISVDITAHPPISIHSPQISSSVSNTPHLRSAVSTVSHIRLSVSTEPHIRVSMSITHHFRSSLKLSYSLLKEDAKVPSSTETSHNGFLMVKSSRHVGRLLSAQTWVKN